MLYVDDEEKITSACRKITFKNTETEKFNSGILKVNDEGYEYLRKFRHLDSIVTEDTYISKQDSECLQQSAVVSPKETMKFPIFRAAGKLCCHTPVRPMINWPITKKLKNVLLNFEGRISR